MSERIGNAERGAVRGSSRPWHQMLIPAAMLAVGLVIGCPQAAPLESELPGPAEPGDRNLGDMLAVLDGVTGDKPASDSVTRHKIADGTIAGDDIAPGQHPDSHLPAMPIRRIIAGDGLEVTPRKRYRSDRAIGRRPKHDRQQPAGRRHRAW